MPDMAVTLPVQAAQDKPKLLDQVRDVIRRKHFSIRTEQAYVDWARKGCADALKIRRFFSPCTTFTCCGQLVTMVFTLVIRRICGSDSSSMPKAMRSQLRTAVRGN